LDLVMTAISQPNHPLRLAALFFGTIVAFAIVLTAALAAHYVWLEETQSGPGMVVSGAPAGAVAAGDGVAVVITAATPEEFESLAGFAPFVPERVPEGTDGTPKYAVTQPDANGFRVGRVAFSAKPGVEVDGISGPVIVIGQARGAPGDGVDGEIKRIGGAGRVLAATLACGELVIDVQMYFSPAAPADGEEIVTRYMRDVARQFVDTIVAQCGGE
jgi:hypothetical protein